MLADKERRVGPAGRHEGPCLPENHQWGATDSARLLAETSTTLPVVKFLPVTTGLTLRRFAALID